MLQHKPTNMIPTVSPAQDIITQRIKMQHSPILPPFTPHSKLRSNSQNRGVSPWKQVSQTVERFPPLKTWKEDSRDDVYLNSATIMHPFKATSGQYKSFRSTTVLRSVPIMRRHLDTFGGRTFSLPAKTKPVPFHTGRFIYDPNNRPAFVEELTQNQRLQAEMAMVEKVRGLKRKREAMEHRWGWRKLDLSGIEMTREQRYSINAEVQKLKELILPTHARDIYTGRGIRMPDTHHTMRPSRARQDDPPNPPPPSAMVGGQHEPPRRPTPPYTRPQPGAGWNAQSREPYRVQPQSSVDLVVQSVPVPGISASPAPKTAQDPDNTKEANFPQPQPTPVMKMHEPVEQIQVVEPQGVAVEEDDAEKVTPSPAVADTPDHRSRSMAAPSASPDGKVHFNPLVTSSGVDDVTPISEELQEMKESYSKLDENNAGHISFEKLITSFPSQLSPCQMRFLHCLYDITTQNQLFGADEFIAMNNLSRSITKLR
uniref:uncharacterized protein LOC100178465 isoform X1 n=2 Tax=Ciona intestinalis TaxID=7719 RepID=UPI000EF5481E|nr:uncharacterized protein LOC100178465 isoform X1 [Ciona intestinalis]|eukprot:XP_026696510.1 uncharacterized protein LOC100178465 isoform X1 [Ciona intestinalis]